MVHATRGNTWLDVRQTTPREEFGNFPTHPTVRARRCWSGEVRNQIRLTYRYRCCIYRQRRCLGWDSLGCRNSDGDSRDRSTRDRYYGCVDSACCQSFRDWDCYCRRLARVSCRCHRARCCFCGLTQSLSPEFAIVRNIDLLLSRLCKLVQLQGIPWYR